LSVLATQISAALGALKSAAGQTLEYRLAVSGSWTALAAGSFLEQTDPQLIAYDEKNRAVMAPARAMLRVGSGQTHLIPGRVEKPGSQVRHTLGSAITQWAVVGATHHDAVSVYELQRSVVQSAGDPRGSMPT
jgi:hypothetical protein